MKKVVFKRLGSSKGTASSSSLALLLSELILLFFPFHQPWMLLLIVSICLIWFLHPVKRKKESLFLSPNGDRSLSKLFWMWSGRKSLDYIRRYHSAGFWREKKSHKSGSRDGIWKREESDRSKDSTQVDSWWWWWWCRCMSRGRHSLVMFAYNSTERERERERMKSHVDSNFAFAA